VAVTNAIEQSDAVVITGIRLAVDDAGVIDQPPLIGPGGMLV
jgi:hypothetical protein